MERDGKRQDKSADITYRLANFKSRQPPKGGQYANQGDKKQTATCRSHKVCPQGLPDGLQIHVRQTDQRQQGKRQKLPAQGARADVYDRGIGAKAKPTAATTERKIVPYLTQKKKPSRTRR